MRLYALILTLCVLRAQAASIPAKIVPDLEKKLVEETPQKDNKPIDNVSSEQELIDQAAPVKDVGNNLRKGIQNIPVEVVVEDVKIALKTGGVKKSEDNEVVPEENPDIKRVEIDLNNPGEPQHQEHDTQNPEHFEDMQKAVENIKKNIADTQIVFKQGLKGVADDIQNWFSNNEQISSIQQSIQSLQISFTNQISKLNETVQGYFKPQSSISTTPVIAEPANDPVAHDIKKVELRIKTLESNFETGVKTLTEGVEVLATLRAENENVAAAVAPANPPANGNPFSQYLQVFQNTISQGFANMTTAIQNYINQNQQNNQADVTSNGPGSFLQGFGINIFQTTPAGAQSDEAGPTTVRPGIWQGFQAQIQNIFNQGQVQSDQSPQGQAPAGPFVQAIQSNPIVQGIVNIIQPKPQASTGKPATSQDALSQAGTNVVPVNAKPDNNSDEQKNPEQQVLQGGPIRQMIQNSPVVQGIAGTLQKIQDSIHPEKPRDTVKDKPTDAKGHGSWGSHDSHEHNSSGNSSGLEKEPVKTDKEDIDEIKKEEDKAKEVLKKD